ncbi:hypothetical protein SG34_031210 [Thalassomonas viridans]|uniref:Bacteriocin n=1 Tax=Thalassomonas viridans TaxID=137584 RepID=A0AAE9ZBG0_9GAMM|nr:hypothetical protein [Thalassomonas viridans]WDE09234.1 hypothetical protein SG34_031210 [Thalassomonas viridans]
MQDKKTELNETQLQAVAGGKGEISTDLLKQYEEMNVTAGDTKDSQALY